MRSFAGDNHRCCRGCVIKRCLYYFTPNLLGLNWMRWSCAWTRGFAPWLVAPLLPPAAVRSCSTQSVSDGLNPSSIRVKYSLIVLGGGWGIIFTISLFWPPYWKKKRNKIWIETLGFCQAVSNREICFIKAVLILCGHGHFFQQKIENGVPPPYY